MLPAACPAAVQVLTHVMTALYLMQITMLGLLGLKKFVYTPVLLPLPVATLVFHIAISRVFAKPWSLMSMHDAAMLDGCVREAGAVAGPALGAGAGAGAGGGSGGGMPALQLSGQ